MAFVRANGGVVHYADEGPRAAKPIVFINSLGTDFRIWDEVADAAGAECARSSATTNAAMVSPNFAPARASMADFATDLAALLDHLERARATIVGLSIGGMIAQELYRLRPDLVAALVLCDTAHRIGTAGILGGAHRAPSRRAASSRSPTA